MITDNESLDSKRTINLFQRIPVEQLAPAIIKCASTTKDSAVSLSFYVFSALLYSEKAPDQALEQWKVATEFCINLIGTVSSEDSEYFRCCLGLFSFNFLDVFFFKFSELICDFVTFLVQQCLPHITDWSIFSSSILEQLIFETIRFCILSSPIQWERLFSLFSKIIEKLTWKDSFPVSVSQVSFDICLKLLDVDTKDDGSSIFKDVGLLIVYLYQLHHYFIHYIEETPHVLFSCPTNSNIDEPSLKKPRYTTSDNESWGNELESLLIAYKYSKVIDANHKILQFFKNESTKLWINFGECEMLSIAEEYEQSNQRLQLLCDSNLKPSNHSEYWIFIIHLKLASNYCCLHNHSEARNILFRLLHELPFPTIVLPDISLFNKHIPCEKEKIIKSLTSISSSSISIQCLQYLLWSFKETGQPGNVITLMQYNWPQFRNEFIEYTSLDNFRKGFTYSQFLKRVTCIDVLEEFYYMLDQDRYNINITPEGSKGLFSKDMQKKLILSHVGELHNPILSVNSVLSNFFAEQLQ